MNSATAGIPGLDNVLTGGLTAMAKMRKVTVVRGIGTFLDPYHLEVQETTGSGSEATGKKQVKP